MDAKTLCLGVLTLGDASGYEIKKYVEEGPFSHFHHTSFGSIYPALKKLRDEGLVNCQEVAQDGRPDKKVYSLTEAGTKAFVAAISQAPERDYIRIDTFAFLFFGHLMDPEHRRRIFDGYLGELKTLFADMQEWDLSEASEQRRFVHGFGEAYYRMAIDYMENNRALLLGDAGNEEAAE